jgi:hypothetical protein
METLNVNLVNLDTLRDFLITRTLIGQKGNIMIVEYKINMLGKGKLKAAAKKFFTNGIFRHVKTTINVNYDFGTKFENRTGEEYEAKGNWQQAVIVGGHISPLSIHKKDVEQLEPVMKIRHNANAYLRYESMTENQRNAGFGRNDFSHYVDANGIEIDKETVKPFYFDREEQIINHRTLTLSNVIRMQVDGEIYELQPAITEVERPEVENISTNVNQPA